MQECTNIIRGYHERSLYISGYIRSKMQARTHEPLTVTADLMSKLSYRSVKLKAIIQLEIIIFVWDVAIRLVIRLLGVHFVKA